MHACMYSYMYVCMYVRMYVCAYVRMHVCAYVCTPACMYVRIYVCMYVCISYTHMGTCFVSTALWIGEFFEYTHMSCMHVCMYVCMYVCMICMTMCTYSFTYRKACNFQMINSSLFCDTNLMPCRAVRTHVYIHTCTLTHVYVYGYQLASRQR
jgi:hypothetical protein